MSGEYLDKERIKAQPHEKSTLHIFFMFFNDKVVNLIITFSNKYAKDNNKHDFDLTHANLLKCIRVMMFTGYHKLPDIYIGQLMNTKAWISLKVLWVETSFIISKEMFTYQIIVSLIKMTSLLIPFHISMW